MRWILGIGACLVPKKRLKSRKKSQFRDQKSQKVVAKSEEVEAKSEEVGTKSQPKESSKTRKGEEPRRSALKTRVGGEGLKERQDGEDLSLYCGAHLRFCAHRAGCFGDLSVVLAGI